MTMLYYAFGTKEGISAGIFSPLPNRRIRGDPPNVELEFQPTFSPASSFLLDLHGILFSWSGARAVEKRAFSCTSLFEHPYRKHLKE
jgi:hypothetical protein